MNTHRRCGDCQLCCKLLAVRELSKDAGERCRHQRAGKGCMIYRQPGMPPSCALWSCRWIVNDDTADLSRPDRSHYVIDIMPDFVTLRHNETGETRPVQVVQVWVDPDFPDAHRDPRLRDYLLRRGEEGIAAIIRYGSSDGFTLFSPPLADDGKWHEVHSQAMGATHTPADLLAALGPVQIGITR